MNKSIFARLFVLAVAVVMLLSITPFHSAFASGETDFYGTIQSLPGTPDLVGDWQVDTVTVHVTASTIIDQSDGAVAVGAFVEVNGTTQSDGSVTATKIEVKSSATGTNFTKFIGTIQSLPSTLDLTGDWVVGTTTVHVTTSTKIDQSDGAAVVGATVKVEGQLLADGSVNAGEIEVIDSPQNGTSVEFKGVVQTLPNGGLIGDWTVNGRIVHVSLSTKIDQSHGAAQVGSYVDVQGTGLADGSVNAFEIEVRNTAPAVGQFIKFTGMVQGLPNGALVGDWVVDGRVVHVSLSTVIDQENGAVAVGDTVEVKGLLQSDGSVNATKIEVKSPGSKAAFSATKLKPAFVLPKKGALRKP